MGEKPWNWKGRNKPLLLQARGQPTVELGSSGSLKNAGNTGSISVNTNTGSGTNNSATLGGGGSATVKVNDNFSISGNGSYSKTEGTNTSAGQALTTTMPANVMKGELMMKVTVTTTVTTTTTTTHYEPMGLIWHTSDTSTSKTTKTVFSTPNENSRIGVVRVGM